MCLVYKCHLLLKLTTHQQSQNKARGKVTSTAMALVVPRHEKVQLNQADFFTFSPSLEYGPGPAGRTSCDSVSPHLQTALERVLAFPGD